MGQHFKCKISHLSNDCIPQMIEKLWYFEFQSSFILFYQIGALDFMRVFCTCWKGRVVFVPGCVEHMEVHVLLNVHWLLHGAPCCGYNDSNLIVCVLLFISARPLHLTLRPICLWFRTAAPAALSASASVPSSTASKWLPGQRSMCQREASLKPSCLYAE